MAHEIDTPVQPVPQSPPPYNASTCMKELEKARAYIARLESERERWADKQAALKTEIRRLKAKCETHNATDVGRLEKENRKLRSSLARAEHTIREAKSEEP